MGSWTEVAAGKLAVRCRVADGVASCGRPVSCTWSHTGGSGMTTQHEQRGWQPGMEGYGDVNVSSAAPRALGTCLSFPIYPADTQLSPRSFALSFTMRK